MIWLALAGLFLLEILMATILPPAETSFFDANGNPLAGGTVTFYVPNTTVPKDTYQNTGQSILNSNPVVLDSAGRAIIFGSGSYRQILKDSLGNIIWDRNTAEPTAGITSYGGVSSGTANAQTLSAGTFDGSDGSTIVFSAGLTNTGPMTLSVGGSSPIAVLKNSISGPVVLSANDIVAGNTYSVAYSSSLASFVLLQNVGHPGYAVRTGNYTAVLGDNESTSRFTTAGTLSLTSASVLGSGWLHRVTAYGVDVFIDPNGTETINGAQTLILKSGQTAQIVCDGISFWADVRADTLSGPQIQGYSFGLGLSTNATDSANDVDIAVGAAASDTSPYYLMQLATALTKRIDAPWAVGSNNGGLDTGTVLANGLYYLYEIQRSDTGVVDALFSLSTSPVMPPNYDRKRLLTSLARVSSVNSDPLPVNRPVQRTDSLVSLSTAAFDFTGISSDVTRITIDLGPLTFSAAAILNIQLGTSGGIVTSGYLGSAISITASSSIVNVTDGFRLGAGGAQAAINNGNIILDRVSGNLWIAFLTGTDTLPRSLKGDGAITLAGPLTQFRVTTTAGSATIGGLMRVRMEK